MKVRYRLLLFLSLFLTNHICTAQGSLSDSAITFIKLNIDYAGYAPGGDMDERFGFSSSIGAGLEYKFASNFFVGFSFRGLFGGRVREPVAWNIMGVTQDPKSLAYTGAIIGADGKIVEVRFQQRGMLIPITVGKVFPIFKGANPNSGLYVEAGGQFIQHKIHLEVVGGNAPALSKEYRKGYDRLSNGFGAVEGFGIRYHGNNRLVNFHAGLEFSQNFTKNRRAVNFDTGETEFQPRMDLMFGIKVGWSFLIYDRAPDNYYYF